MAKKQKFNIDEAAAEYKALKLAEAQAKEDAAKKAKPIMAYLKKHKLTKGAFDRWNVTLVEPEDTLYDLDVLREGLSKKDFKRCVREVPDKDGILELVNKGVIGKKLLARAITVSTKAPYILVNPKKD